MILLGVGLIVIVAVITIAFAVSFGNANNHLDRL
jgi:hypothetical protein